MEIAEARLFELPHIEVDRTSPDVLRLSFSGVVELDRANVEHATYFNALRAGRDATICITARIVGGAKLYKFDEEGDVEAVVETKRLIATEVYVAGVD